MAGAGTGTACACGCIVGQGLRQMHVCSRSRGSAVICAPSRWIKVSSRARLRFSLLARGLSREEGGVLDERGRGWRACWHVLRTECVQGAGHLACRSGPQSNAAPESARGGARE
jgi:hypothetical protein